MANTSATYQQAAHATCQLPSPSSSTRSIQKKPLTLDDKCLGIFWTKKSIEQGGHLNFAILDSTLIMSYYNDNINLCYKGHQAHLITWDGQWNSLENIHEVSSPR